MDKIHEDDDLEDGEIETDDENDEENKVSAGTDNASAKNDTEVGAPKSNNVAKSTNKGTEVTSKKGKLSSEDDWMTNVANAIAKELWKDGVEPPQPSSMLSNHNHHHSNVNNSKYSDEDNSDLKRSKTSTSSSSKSKRRRKDDKSWDKLLETQKKKQKVKSKRSTADMDVDFESEMLLVRGGSPTLHPTSDIDLERRSNYDSEYSTGSTYSMDSAEQDRVSYEERKRRRSDKYSRNNERSSSNRNRSDNKRTRNTRGNDRYLDDEVCVRFLEGKCHSDNCPRIHTLPHSSHSRTPKKMELCKFYLMECCAKREKCLYMHSDFPCKYYYLGLTCQNKDTTCKFAHGKPLTDELKQILLKHLETAPKEILGDFPRISRDRALNLITSTHLKLCKEYGVEIPQNSLLGNMNAGGNGNFAKKIPSLLEVVTSNPISMSSTLQSLRDREKPRKTRWCDTSNTNMGGNVNNSLLDNYFKSKSGSMNSCSDTPSITPSANSPGNATAVSSETDDYLSIRYLNGVITSEQIDQLTGLGITNIKEMSNLTVAQLNNVGLTALQINEIQLNALNMKQLGLTNEKANIQAKLLKNASAVATQGAQSTLTNSTLSSGNTTLSAATPTPTTVLNNDTEVSETPKAVDNLFTGQDLDMRMSTGTSTTTPASTDSLSIGCDVDMRFIPQSSKSNGVNSSNDICEIKSPDHTFNTGITSEHHRDLASASAPVETPAESAANVEIVDFSQYLKDSNITDDLTKLDEDDALLHIDESWMNNNNDYDDDDDDDDEHKLRVDVEPLIDDKNEESSDSDSETVQDDINEIEKQAEADARDKKNEEELTKREDERENMQNKIDNRNKAQSEILLPAIIDTKSVLNANRLSKIDLSTSVAKLLNKNEPMEFENRKLPVERSDEKPILYAPLPDASSGNSTLPIKVASSRDPRAALLASMTARTTSGMGSNTASESRDPRHHGVSSITATAPATTTDTEYFDMVADVQNHIKMRKSIYDRDEFEISTSDDEGNHSRKPDKDMRLTSYMMASDGSNGDVDLRFPFKPILSNYIPATEIDCSINSHPPMPYKVYEIEIPKPDYKEIRRSFRISVQENKQDPRLRRIFGYKESDYDEQHNSGDDMFSSKTIASPTIASPPQTSSAPTIQPVAQKRVDPRRKKDDLSLQNTLLPSNPNIPQKTTSIEMQTIIQNSEWYNNLSTKQKILVNQHLAMLTQELKEYHAECANNQDNDKPFNLNIVKTNPVLQQILESLGYYVSEDGKFVEVKTELLLGGPGMGAGSGIINSNFNNMSGFNNFTQQQQQMQLQQLHASQIPAPQLINSNNMGIMDFLNMKNRMGNVGQQMHFSGNMNQPPPPSLINDMNMMHRPSLLGLPPQLQQQQQLLENNYDSMIPSLFLEQNSLNFNSNNNGNNNPYFGDNRNNNRNAFMRNTNNSNNNSNRNERWNQRGRNNNNNDMRSRRGNNTNRGNDKRNNRREKSKN